MDKPFFTKGFICSHVLRECELFGELYGVVSVQTATFSFPKPFTEIDIPKSINARRKVDTEQSN